MAEIRICFEVNGIAEDEGGMPCPAGLQITLGESDKEIDYAELVKDVNIPAVLKMAFLQDYIKPENVRVITPEEYDLRFGEEPERRASMDGSAGNG